jgi:hypothetical protein
MGQPPCRDSPRGWGLGSSDRPVRTVRSAAAGDCLYGRQSALPDAAAGVTAWRSWKWARACARWSLVRRDLVTDETPCFVVGLRAGTGARWVEAGALLRIGANSAPAFPHRRGRSSGSRRQVISGRPGGVVCCSQRLPASASAIGQRLRFGSPSVCSSCSGCSAGCSGAGSGGGSTGVTYPHRSQLLATSSGTSATSPGT